MVGLELSYALAMRHRMSVEFQEGEKLMFAPGELASPNDVAEYIDLVTGRLKVKISPAEKSAFDALWMLTKVLQDGWVSREWMVDLPLAVAAVGGKTASYANSKKGSQPRRRRQTDERKEAALDVRRQHPGESWKERLVRLKGEGTVLEFDAKEIHWYDESVTSVGTFRNWK